MSVIYKPPSTQDLAILKANLQKSNVEMAQLFGMDPDHWRKYTGGKDPRSVSMPMLFFAMAKLELDKKCIERILNRMREVGATIALDSPSQP